jgi:hypothetical protein
MKELNIPDDVLRFIERRIDSVPHLETLLLLREQPEVSWSDGAVAARVYVSRERARDILRDLSRNGLISPARHASELYSYSEDWDELNLMEKVAETYRHHLIGLSRIIHEKAGSAAVQDFARAFQFKREE